MKLGHEWMDQSHAVITSQKSDARMPNIEGSRSRTHPLSSLMPHMKSVETRNLPPQIRDELQSISREFLHAKQGKNPSLPFQHYEKELYREFLQQYNEQLQSLREKRDELLDKDVTKDDMERLRHYKETLPKSRSALFADASMRRNEYMRKEFPHVVENAEKQRKRLWEKQVKQPMDVRTAACAREKEMQPTWNVPGERMTPEQFQSLYRPHEVQRQVFTRSRAFRPFI